VIEIAAVFERRGVARQNLQTDVIEIAPVFERFNGQGEAARNFETYPQDSDERRRFRVKSQLLPQALTSFVSCQFSSPGTASRTWPRAISTPPPSLLAGTKCDTRRRDHFFSRTSSLQRLGNREW
jgi:hypothetical protein